MQKSVAGFANTFIEQAAFISVTSVSTKSLPSCIDHVMRKHAISTVLKSLRGYSWRTSLNFCSAALVLNSLLTSRWSYCRNRVSPSIIGSVTSMQNGCTGVGDFQRERLSVSGSGVVFQPALLLWISTELIRSASYNSFPLRPTCRQPGRQVKASRISILKWVGHHRKTPV